MGVLALLLGIYKKTIAHKKMNIEKDYLATKAIPFLLPISVDPGLNLNQVRIIMQRQYGKGVWVVRNVHLPLTSFWQCTIPQGSLSLQLYMSTAFQGTVTSSSKYKHEGQFTPCNLVLSYTLSLNFSCSRMNLIRILLFK